MRKTLLAFITAVFALGCTGSEPSAPVNLSVRAVSPSEMEVTWEPAHEWQEIEHFMVYRNSAFYLKTIAPGLVDTGLSNATTYCYSVSAVNDGNESSKTGPECDTTPAVLDIEAPSIPAGLVVNTVSESRLDLFWDESTDNVGVRGYNIFRGGADIGNTPATEFGDTGLSASTEYCYTVSAFDSAGNESTGSTQACAFTDAAP